MSDATLDPERLDNRSILKGARCICGQWWPDYTTHNDKAVMECCGSTYQFSSGSGSLVTLSLVTDNTQPKEDQA